MRIVIDAFPVRVGRARIGIYTMGLLAALARVTPEHDYYLADFGPRLSTTKVRPGLLEADYEADVRALVAGVPLPKKVQFGLTPPSCPW